MSVSEGTFSAAHQTGPTNLLEPDPAVLGRGTPWTGRQCIAETLQMTNYIASNMKMQPLVGGL